MSKAMILRADKKTREFIDEARRMQSDLYYSDLEIARAMGVSPQTWARRKKDPENLTLREALIVGDFLGLEVVS